MQKPAYNAGLYLRLSRDDELQGDSSSIVTQRQMLRKYANDNNITVYDEYVDDGWSGTNFDRPSFKRLIDDVENGRINCVIVKDLSRLGRNYILTGQYTELYFPSHNVRFIAVNDNVDTINGDNEFAPFKNIINEWYARDVSKKIRAVFKTKQSMGEYLGTYPPIGYKRSPDVHNKLIINEDNKWIVEKIFSLATQGVGAARIAKILFTEKVPTPAWLNYQENGAYANHFMNQPEETHYRWSTSQVLRLLKNEVYIGNIINNKYTTISYKNKKCVRLPESEWYKIENAHEPIIDKDTFNIVQEKIDVRRRSQKDKTPQIFAGLVRCADCGYAMKYSSNTKTAKRYFSCTTNYLKGKETCTLHYIKYDALYKYVLERIQYWTSMAQNNEDKLWDILSKNCESESITTKQKRQSELKKTEKRLSELDNLVAKLYEDRLQGKINDRNADILIAKYQKEQDDCQEKIITLSNEIKSNTDEETNKQKWVALLKQYTNPQELSAPLLNALIQKIVIHEAIKTPSGRIQSIEIHYLFIGTID